jgi:hypothetical protein
VGVCDRNEVKAAFGSLIEVLCGGVSQFHSAQPMDCFDSLIRASEEVDA